MAIQLSDADSSRGVIGLRVQGPLSSVQRLAQLFQQKVSLGKAVIERSFG